MLNKVQSYAILSGDTARQITSSREQWTDFLRLAGRLYKYPFGEQLLIYAQRPEAEACAEYDFWNSRMQRYVRRGSKGIALIEKAAASPGSNMCLIYPTLGDGANPICGNMMKLNIKMWLGRR